MKTALRSFGEGKTKERPLSGGKVTRTFLKALLWPDAPVLSAGSRLMLVLVLFEGRDKKGNGREGRETGDTRDEESFPDSPPHAEEAISTRRRK